MAALPYMQLFVSDYLADTAHLTTVEHGAYLLLIMNYWQRGKPLPDDDVRLARIVGMSPEEWAKIAPTIREYFQSNGTDLVHRRIERDLRSVAAKSAKASRSASGKRSKSERKAIAKRTQSERAAILDTDTNSDTDLDTSKKSDVGGIQIIRDEYPPDFEAFCDVYPKAVDRAKAFPHWDRLVKFANPPDVIILSAKNYSENCRREETEPRYIKHAHTFLADGRWKDFLTAPTEPSKVEPNKCPVCGNMIGNGDCVRCGYRTRDDITDPENQKYYEQNLERLRKKEERTA